MGRVLIKGGVWRNTEDEILKAAVMKYGKNQWSRIASLLHRKSAKQCKSRWHEWLDPSIKKTEWSREEEEKLINLVRLMPTQWRTIASIVGRTASQCLEHYEQLLDQVQNKEKDPTLDDPRKLKPGEIDPNPETKPARPDPKDMDEDELEMLSEARARLANTQGKKAKRKAREKQLEEARRLASVQKRRELRMAGINLQMKHRKNKRTIDYNNEIPFEKAVPIGFHDTNEDVYDPSGHDFKKLRQQQLDGELPSEREERERKKDKQKLKKKREEGIPSTLNQNIEVSRPRSKLVLPQPVISETEIEQVVKLGKASELAKESAVESGNAVSDTLLADYSLSTSVHNIRTPKTSAFSRDNILMEAQNLIALNNVDTPLLGGANVPLMDVPELSAATPAGLLGPSATPNPLIATPFRSSHSMAASSRALVPSVTPGQREHFATPLATPLRDKLAINSEDALVENVNSKKYNKELKQSLQQAFSSLPLPKNEYEIVVNDEPNDDSEQTNDNAVSMDQSEVDANNLQQRVTKQVKEQKWTQAVKRQLPRPVDVRNMIQSTSTTSTLLTKAEELIKEEMTKMLYFDALVNPTDDQTLLAAVKNKNVKSASKTYESLLNAHLEKNPIEKFEDDEIKQAKLLLEEEMKNVEQSMDHGKITPEVYSQVWDECNSQLLFLPSQGRYTRANIVSKRERIESIDHFLNLNRHHMAREAKKAAKVEKKLSILLGGYQTKANELEAQIKNDVHQIEQFQTELLSFQGLQVREDRAIAKRIEALEYDVNRQIEREKALQKRYSELVLRCEQNQLEDSV